MIDPELARFLQEGLGIHLGTRDSHLHPNGARAAAVKIEDDGQHLLLYIAKIAAARVMPDLHSNGQAAVTFARPTDDRACQVKGVFVSARPARAAERTFVAAQWAGFMKQLATIGIPPAAAAEWITWPAVAIRLRTTAVFDQTPGPAAGAPIA